MSTVYGSGSAFVHRALDLLLLRSPYLTSIGVVLGLVIDLLVSILSPVLASSHLIDLSRVKEWQWIPLGILICHLPTLFGYGAARSANQAIDEAIQLIERGHFSVVERRAKYRMLIEAVLQNVRFHPSAATDLEGVQSQMNDRT